VSVKLTFTQLFQNFYAKQFFYKSDKVTQMRRKTYENYNFLMKKLVDFRLITCIWWVYVYNLGTEFSILSTSRYARRSL